MSKVSCFVVCSVCLSLLLPSTADAGDVINHGPLNKILRKYVRGGVVNYSGIKANAKAELEAYVKAVGSASVRGSKNARLAFYLNAYNASVIKAVVDRLPVKSVMKVPGFFKRIKHKVAGRNVTLNALENSIIRPKFKDARIHFALVCAARSCPPLQSRAFREATVNRDLEKLTTRFVASRRGVQLSGNSAKISKLFTWYKADFKPTVNEFLAKYRKKDAAALKAAKLSYLGYSWALNGR